MLKFSRTPTGSISAAATTSSSNSTVSALRPIINRKTSFVTSECGYSKATVVLKSLSLPLAWPSDEYFSTKRERRAFTVQLVIKTTDGKEFFSKPIENVDRSHIDIVFDDVFYIEDQPPDFKLELTVYCRRTDENANNMGTLSRSVGKNVANSLKRYVQSWNTTNLARMQKLDQNFIENYRDPEKMCPLGSAEFKLQNASLSGRKHNYAIRQYPHIIYGGIPKSHVLPLFGQISLVILVQPLSLASALAQGTLDVFYVEGGILLQKLFCILQGTFLKCFNCDPQEITQHTKPDMFVPINEYTQVETTAFQTALRLKLIDQETQEIRHFVCVTGTQQSFLGWKNALKMQMKDTEIWEGFAISSSNPHGAQLPPKPQKTGTFGRNVRFENSNEKPQKSATLGPMSVSEPRYGFELQSTRRPRPPITNAFKQKESPKPKPRRLNNKEVEEIKNLNSPTEKVKPVPKPRAYSELSSSAYVISLKIGSNDGLPELTHISGQSSSSSSINDSTLTSTNKSSTQPTDSKDSSLNRRERLDNPAELPPKFVYGVGTGLQLIRNRPPTTINRSTTLYNSRSNVEMTKL